MSDWDIIPDYWLDKYNDLKAFEKSEGIISERYKEDEYHTIENNSISIGSINREYGYMSEDDCFLKSKSDEKYYLQKFYHYEDEYLGTPDALEYSNYIREVNYQEIIDTFVEEETHKEKNPYSVDIHYRDEKLEYDVNTAWYEKLYKIEDNDEELDLTEQERGRS